MVSFGADHIEQFSMQPVNEKLVHRGHSKRDTQAVLHADEKANGRYDIVDLSEHARGKSPVPYAGKVSTCCIQPVQMKLIKA